MRRQLREPYDRVMLIGDPHIRKEDISEASKFVQYIVSAIKVLENTLNGKKVLPVFMGDQLNDFALARAEVLEFWRWAYDEIRNASPNDHDSLSLEGNHDMNQEESASTMCVYDERTVLAGKTPVFVNPKVAAIGFIRKEELFYKAVMSAYVEGARTILCHAEFEGSQYESGTYAPNGFKLDKYPADLSFITGHIHKQQSFGKVWCIGTPRHLTRSDIGETKGIQLVDFTTGESYFTPTPPDVFEPFKSFVIDESSYDESMLKDIPNSSKVYVEIKGSREFNKTIARILPALVKIRPTYTDRGRQVNLKESEGIPSSFHKFANGFFETNKTDDSLKKAILDKVYERCPSLKTGVR